MEVITTHLNADFDSMASMVAAKKLYPDAILAFSGSQEKNLRKFFVQSVMIYDFQRLKNIELEKITKLIVVDTRQPARIGNFAKCLQNKGIELHLYDHHPDAPGDMKGDVEVVRPVGATTTIFVEIFQKKGITITPEEATLLAMAEYEDTGSFTFSTTTPADLKAMAWLLSCGASLPTASQFITQEMTAKEVVLLHELIKSATTYTINGVDVVVAKISSPYYIDEFSLIVRRFTTMENLNVLFALSRMADKVYLIARSRIPEVNAGQIAMEFNGGGHASAASATISGKTLVEAEEKLFSLLHKHVRPQSLARELMSSPIISIEPDVSLEEANSILTRYSITVLPVLENKKTLRGLLSRREAGKAIFHHLGKLPVSEFMSTEFATLPPSASLAEIQELIIEHRQRFIPVVDNDTLVGVITRTDLFNLLVNDPSYLPALKTSGSQPSAERNRNLSNLIVQKLSRDVIVLLRTIGEIARSLDYTAYAVGGFVRDLLLHTSNLDIDIVIEGDGIIFAKKMAEKLEGSVKTHAKFKTAVVKLPQGIKIDIATARMEYYESPAALPIVELSSIKLDLYRRDFTINAMAMHLNPGKFGILVDFFNCQNDLKDHKIRILHNMSFVEDPTRIFRAIRLEQRMGFTLGKLTERQIKNAVKMNLFGQSLGRRYFQEMKLILSEKNPLPAIYRLAQFDLLKFLHKSLRIDPRLSLILEEANRAMSWHKLLYLNDKCRPWMVYMLALTSRLQTRGLLAFCHNIEVPERYTLILIREKVDAHRVIRTLQRRVHIRPSEIFWLLKGFSQEGLLYVMAICRNKIGQQAVSTYVTQLRNIKNFTHGADLKKMGYTPGPTYQTMLNHLLEAKLDGLIHSREDEIQLLKEHYPLDAD
ncbi:MAG: CBS domain-containing protein [Desulfobulbaceae bacterium]|uniref:CBS domain-containing protein n=1 Tax=Candidatus Desulfobia pelagia TaxID=2841692 RepID=A0A8J6NED1_9BACT|nr:CBS domain-containing protein [Candidatus Desulfobia pelagia]